MTDLPLATIPSTFGRLGGVMDVEAKIPRALRDLGLPATSRTAIVDVPGTDWATRVCEGGRPVIVAPEAPLRLPVDDGSLDAVVGLWTSFRGVSADDLAEADRALRAGGRLLVVHDYGRDDVSLLRDPGAPEYGTWSRREGPFLRDAGFKIRVVHCYWTFPTMDAAREGLATLGPRGEVVADGLRRPRLTWNVAVYHRTRPDAGAEPQPGRLLRSGT